MWSNNKSVSWNLELSIFYQTENIFPSMKCLKRKKICQQCGWQLEEHFQGKPFEGRWEKHNCNHPFTAETSTKAESFEQVEKVERTHSEYLLSKTSMAYFRFLICSVSRYPSLVCHALCLKLLSSCSNGVMSQSVLRMKQHLTYR